MVTELFTWISILSCTNVNYLKHIESSMLNVVYDGNHLWFWQPMMRIIYVEDYLGQVIIMLREVSVTMLNMVYIVDYLVEYYLCWDL